MALYLRSSINSDRAVLSKTARSVQATSDPPNSTCFCLGARSQFKLSHCKRDSNSNSEDNSATVNTATTSTGIKQGHVPTTTYTPTPTSNGADMHCSGYDCNDCNGSAMRSVCSSSFILNFDSISCVCSG